MSSLDLPKLPLRMWREIFLRSPAESVFRFRAVCKGWRKVIDYPSFSRAHTFDHLSSSSHTTLVLKDSHLLHTVDIDALDFSTIGGRLQAVSASSYELAGSTLLARLPVPACNGLILVHPPRLDEGRFEIWNPSTHEILRLPQVCFCPSRPVLFGLGYDRATQDLKVVAVDRQATRVYSLRSDTWCLTTDVGCCPGCVRDRWPEQHAAAVLAQGALHWLLRDKRTILALDLETEECRHIKLKESMPATKQVDVLGGCLAVSGFSVSRFNVWVMNVDESWAMLVSIKRVDLIPFGWVDLRPLAYVNDDKKQVFLIDGRSGSRGLFVFDLESDSLTSTVRIEGVNGHSDAQIIPRSLFRLRDNCGPRRRILPLDPPQKKRNLSFEITACPAPPLKKHKKDSYVAGRF